MWLFSFRGVMEDWPRVDRLYRGSRASASSGIRPMPHDTATSCPRGFHNPPTKVVGAETVIGLFKTEEIHRRGPWKGLEDIEFATLEWVAWYNGSRLLEPLGYVPPAEFEKAYHDRQAAPVGMAVLT